MRSLKKFIISFIICTCIFSGLVYADPFGGDDAMISQILGIVNTHTGTLATIEGQTTATQSITDTQWINMYKYFFDGLDALKTYTAPLAQYLDLSKMPTLGTVSDNLQDLGINLKTAVAGLIPSNSEIPNSGLPNWVDQIYGTAPTSFYSTSDVSAALDRSNGIEAYNQFLTNRQVNNTVKQQYSGLYNDASNATPGIASRISAESGVIQNLQLANLNDTQSELLKVSAKKSLDDSFQQQTHDTMIGQSFSGLSQTLSQMPTLGN